MGDCYEIVLRLLVISSGLSLQTTAPGCTWAPDHSGGWQASIPCYVASPWNCFKTPQVSNSRESPRWKSELDPRPGPASRTSDLNSLTGVWAQKGPALGLMLSSTFLEFLSFEQGALRFHIHFALTSTNDVAGLMPPEASRNMFLVHVTFDQVRTLNLRAIRVSLEFRLRSETENRNQATKWQNSESPKNAASVVACLGNTGASQASLRLSALPRIL